MGYVGTTAASSVSNPPLLLTGAGLAGGILGSTQSGTKLWLYSSTDGSTVMQSSTYFTDGFYLGMRQGDMLIGAAGASVGSTTPLAYIGVLGICSTAGVGLSTGGTITSSFT